MLESMSSQPEEREETMHSPSSHTYNWQQVDGKDTQQIGVSIAPNSLCVLYYPAFPCTSSYTPDANIHSYKVSALAS